MQADLSVVIPAYNESARLPQTIAQILEFAAKREVSQQVVIVDDGSGDGTGALVRKQFGDQVRVISHERCLGKGAACRTGMLASTGKLVLITDADLPIPIEEWEAFLALGEEAEIVIGSKYMPASKNQFSLARRLGGTLGQVCIKALVVRGFHDTQCGFKLFDRKIGQRLFSVSRLNGYGYDFEILYLARRYGIMVSEVPVRVGQQSGSKVRFLSYLKTLQEALQVASNRVLGIYPSTLPGSVRTF